ncbi:hypothetical protein NC652_037997 [Populus alba x Populus x berolinensis]|nr:hypothetical protein NC652_037997 [Populus alba x Populus x berolinensis]
MRLGYFLNFIVLSLYSNDCCYLVGRCRASSFIAFVKIVLIISTITSRKTEVMNLVESGGFSSSNPYCVVQQGMIPPLTLMKDSECVDVFKEIGGTDVVKA